MRMPKETRQFLEAQGIDLRQARAREAVEEFNRLQRESARMVAALHLTC